MTPNVQRLAATRFNEVTIDQDRMAKDVGYVLDIYKGLFYECEQILFVTDVLQQIFNFYCELFMGYSKGRLCMNKTQFTKFFLNCNLTSASKDMSYELMWIKILRQLNLAKTNHVSGTSVIFFF